MPNPINYITPEKAFEHDKRDNPKNFRSLAYWEAAAKAGGKCEVCDDDAWKYGGVGLCFTCTTGEADPSEDFELKTE